MMEPTQIVWDLRQGEEEMVDIVVAYASRLFYSTSTGIQSPLVSSRLLPCLEEAWPVILQAAALDAVPMNSDGTGYSRTAAENNIWI
ncbi:hypothetical protein LWI29_038293 [Acer saccharum]|uniref:Uncharacterized protein n=1 Tax=Acer saccharum TaxID=4024 RepID=A0AA39TAN2_ACESA|nr:hypothetical protein LWI29_038293 [Acer saccharum]